MKNPCTMQGFHPQKHDLLSAFQKRRFCSKSKCLQYDNEGPPVKKKNSHIEDEFDFDIQKQP
jgi:hypothetical protein